MTVNIVFELVFNKCYLLWWSGIHISHKKADHLSHLFKNFSRAFNQFSVLQTRVLKWTGRARLRTNAMFTFFRQSVQLFGQLTWSNLSEFSLGLQEPLSSCWRPRRPTLAAEKRLAPVVLPMQFRAKNLKLLPMQTMMTCLWPSKLFSGDKQGKIYFFNSQDSLRWCSSLCFFSVQPLHKTKVWEASRGHMCGKSQFFSNVPILNFIVWFTKSSWTNSCFLWPYQWPLFVI